MIWKQKLWTLDLWSNKMRGRTKQELYDVYLAYLELPTYLTTAEMARRSGASESSVRRWRKGESIPPEPRISIETFKSSYNKSRTQVRNQARRLRTITNDKTRYEYSFEEIAKIMNLTVFQTKVVYLNAIRHIRCALEKRGIYLDYPEPTVSSLY